MPAAKPPALKLLNGRGNGKDAAGRPVPVAPKFVRQAPEPPEWLSDEARAEWDRVVPGLEGLDLVKPEDRATLATYCEVWARLVTANADIRTRGLVVENTSTRKDGTESTWFTKNPAVSIAEQAETRLRQYANDFGLSPAGERMIASAPAKSDDSEDDPFGKPQTG